MAEPLDPTLQMQARLAGMELLLVILMHMTVGRLPEASGAKNFALSSVENSIKHLELSGAPEQSAAFREEARKYAWGLIETAFSAGSGTPPAQTS